MRRTYLTLLTSIYLALSSVGCTNVFPPSVNCEGLRALQLGDSKAAVVAKIGEPRTVTPGTSIASPASVEMWGYHASSGLGSPASPKLYVFFNGDRLTDVKAHYQYPLSEKKALLYVNARERYEGADFGSFFGCNQTR